MGFLDSLFAPGGNAGLLGNLPRSVFGPSVDTLDRERLERNQQAAIEGYKGSGVPEAVAIAAARNPGFAASLETLIGGRPTDDIREYQYAKKQGFPGSFTEWQLKKKSGQGEYGLNPIWGVDAEGKPAVMQLGRAGTPVVPQLPNGFTIQNKPIEVDAGTHTILLDPQTRQPIGQIPKNVQEKAQQQQVGKDTGAAVGELASIESKLPGLEGVVTKLDNLSNKATYTTAGKILDSARRELGVEPREGAVSRVEYEAIVKNQIFPLLRDTFGAQFTQKEGEDLRTTLGDPDKSPKEKQAVLRAFIEQKRRDVGALRTRTGAQPAASADAPKFQPPAGWQFSPSRQQYRDPSGKLYDIDGRPL